MQAAATSGSIYLFTSCPHTHALWLGLLMQLLLTHGSYALPVHPHACACCCPPTSAVGLVRGDTSCPHTEETVMGSRCACVWDGVRAVGVGCIAAQCTPVSMCVRTEMAVSMPAAAALSWLLPAPSMGGAFPLAGCRCCRASCGAAAWCWRVRVGGGCLSNGQVSFMIDSFQADSRAVRQ